VILGPQLRFLTATEAGKYPSLAFEIVEWLVCKYLGGPWLKADVVQLQCSCGRIIAWGNRVLGSRWTGGRTDYWDAYRRVAWALRDRNSTDEVTILSAFLTSALVTTSGWFDRHFLLIPSGTDCHIADVTYSFQAKLPRPRVR
jgi:hypothetical protein